MPNDQHLPAVDVAAEWSKLPPVSSMVGIMEQKYAQRVAVILRPASARVDIGRALHQIVYPGQPDVGVVAPQPDAAVVQHGDPLVTANAYFSASTSLVFLSQI